MNCIVIDDEPLAIKVLEKHLSMMDGYLVKSTFTSALPVYKYLQENSIDLIFLDIEMPSLSGLNFLKSLSTQPHVILTTAHREYALESYDYLVADYLLKPISFERFLKSISKLDIQSTQGMTAKKEEQPTLTNDKSNHSFFKIDRQNIRIDFDDILYIESIKNHIKLVLKEKNCIAHMHLHEVQSKLNKNQFVRVHKSFVINLENIESFNHSHIQLGQHQIPIGRTYKMAVMEKLTKNVF